MAPLEALASVNHTTPQSALSKDDGRTWQFSSHPLTRSNTYPLQMWVDPVSHTEVAADPEGTHIGTALWFSPDLAAATELRRHRHR
jgi:hypothetical protein